MKPFWDITDEEAQNCLSATDWRAGVDEYFRGGGFSSHFLSKGDMPITMMRINLIYGQRPVLQLAEG